MSDSTTRNVTARLRKVAQERKVAYNMIVTEYLLECVVRRLVVAKNLASKTVFKGGYVCARVYNSPRYTTDIDLTIRGISAEKAVSIAVSIIEKSADDGAWFQHQKVVDLLTQGEYGGMRIVTRGGLGKQPANPSKSQIFHIDIGINDAISPEASDLTTDSLAGVGSFNWKVYAVETVVAEKVHTMVDRGSENSRSRDIYDINLLLPQCDGETLKTSLATTFTHRQTPLPASISEIFSSQDTSLLRRGWAKVMNNATTEKTFAETFDELIQKLQALEL